MKKRPLNSANNEESIDDVADAYLNALIRRPRELSPPIKLVKLGSELGEVWQNS